MLVLLSGLARSTQLMAVLFMSYECERLCAFGNVAAGESVNVAGISCGGVHGIVGPYISPDMPVSKSAVEWSTPMKVSPEAIDWFRLRAPSKLGGVAQPPSRPYILVIPALTPYIKPSFVTGGDMLERGPGAGWCWVFALSEAFGLPALLDGE